MQALQWAIDFPDWVEHCVALAAAPGLTAQNIAFNEIARHAILSDPDWHEGDYLATGALPTRGLHWREWSATSPICLPTV